MSGQEEFSLELVKEQEKEGGSEVAIRRGCMLGPACILLKAEDL